MHHKFTKLKDLLSYIRQSVGSDPKGVCELGKVPAHLAERISLETGLEVRDYQLTLDSYGVRHAFNGHSQERGSRDHYPLLETDVLTLPNWIFSPAVLKKGALQLLANQPRRLQIEHPTSQQAVKTVVILEVRPRYRRLVLVTMFKTKNG